MMPKTEEEMDGLNNNMPTNLNFSGSSGSGDGLSPITGNQNNSQNRGMTKAELRKSNKPIMEKKRRARINQCLNELKTLMLEALKKDPARHTKLEKADILEMTVKYLQGIQRTQLTMAVQSDPTIIHKFKSGFSECADEVNRFIGQVDGLDPGVKQRLSNHLNTCVTGLQQVSPFANSSSVYRNSGSVGMHLGSTSIPTIPPLLPQDVNNNGRIQIGGVQLIPSRLPTGELAWIMPKNNNIPFYPSSTTSNAYHPPNPFEISTNYPRMSAFNTVTKSNLSRTTPPLSPMSSMSSSGDDSMQPTEFNRSSTTPPFQMAHTSFLSTPPTGCSFRVMGVQQPHISSSTENLDRKRRFSETDDCNGNELNYQTEKRIKYEDTKPFDDENQENENKEEGMWRPW